VSAADPGKEKLAKMEKLEYSASNGIIIFNDKNYEELVTKNPRPYDVVIIYSVSQQCDQCDEVFSEYSSVVYSFLHNKDKVKRPVFFGAMYYSKDNHKFFLQHGFKTVPHLTVSLQKA
jgi:hypothetical protein